MSKAAGSETALPGAAKSSPDAHVSARNTAFRTEPLLALKNAPLYGLAPPPLTSLPDIIAYRPWRNLMKRSSYGLEAPPCLRGRARHNPGRTFVSSAPQKPISLVPHSASEPGTTWLVLRYRRDRGGPAGWSCQTRHAATSAGLPPLQDSPETCRRWAFHAATHRRY